MGLEDFGSAPLGTLPSAFLFVPDFVEFPFLLEGYEIKIKLLEQIIMTGEYCLTND